MTRTKLRFIPLKSKNQRPQEPKEFESNFSWITVCLGGLLFLLSFSYADAALQNVIETPRVAIEEQVTEVPPIDAGMPPLIVVANQEFVQTTQHRRRVQRLVVIGEQNTTRVGLEKIDGPPPNPFE